MLFPLSMTWLREPRIVQLADGEELISFELDERLKTLVHDPREELLEHRRGAGAAEEVYLTMILRDGREDAREDMRTQQPMVDLLERPARDRHFGHREPAKTTIDKDLRPAA